MSDGQTRDRPGTPRRSPTAIERFEREEATTREALLQEHGEAVEKKSWAVGWLMIFGFGPAAALSIALALAAGRPDLIWPFVGLGATVQILRIWREKRHIRRIEEELRDPMDGS